ncbi:MAG: anhydro-N-acetylmuramic acid kinase [Bacteroidetes bacterium HGW-Bacteroidetes-6]|nr:MAG: anhydro-N-acetylmuramic acid kinase [Bacteroidetes bacterium HGW-Bacteroidetes-6]
MSGTSLDGVDIAYCGFRLSNSGWEYRIEQAETIGYSSLILRMLHRMPEMNAVELIKSDRELGSYYGNIAADFIKKHNIEPEFLSSHGHTIFHNPAYGYTFQAGHGANIALEAGVPVVCDFRSGDVALGGQGAPLVPVGDELLFSQYDALVNMGGFANISMNINGKRLAWDICPVNIVLNYFARLKGSEYDKNGQWAKTGILCTELLRELNDISYYSQQQPKSLGREWVESAFLPVIQKYINLSVDDILCTVAHHAANQIADAAANKEKVLFSGGGVRNTFLMSLIRSKSGQRAIAADSILIDFKEALVFAFLGWLRINRICNTLESATGAKKAISSGAIYLP